jgi:succinate-semialdehyde dehydrogenase / glutarate-semialdehyde dehydrogenase
MELGGNAPFVVFDDADLDAAIDGAVLAKMRNIGQAGTAANPFLVHESVAEKFGSELAARLGAMSIGRATDPTVEVGPLIDDQACAKVDELVDDARRRRARALVGGAPLDVLREEIFGPVAPITTFVEVDEALRAANDTEFGLVSYVFTRDLDRALRVCEQIETGMIGLNQGLISNPAAPFGGVKHSGFGREGGPEGIGEYLETKYVAILKH